MKSLKKNFFNIFSSYPFLSPFGWSLKNKDYLGVFLNVSIWFVSIAFIFFITYFTWIIEEIPLMTLRSYLTSGRYLPVLIIVLSLTTRIYVYKKSEAEERISSNSKLFRLRLWFVTKYLFLIFTVPLINNFIEKLNIEILDELTKISQENMLDIVLRTILGQ